MIVEFTGCSGAGKTSLARRVRELLREQAHPAIDPLRLVLGPRLSRLLPARPVSTRVENLAVELLGWRQTMWSRRHYAACDGLVRNWIRDASRSHRERLRLSRSWHRKLAVLASSHRYLSARPVLLQDEGTVHFSMTLLARLRKHPLSALARYLEAVPLPTYVVCVDASPDRRMARLAQRSIKPVPDRDPAARDAFLVRSSDVIESLCQHPRVASCVIRVRNDHDDAAELTRLARDVSQHIIAWQSDLEPATPAAPALDLALQ